MQDRQASIHGRREHLEIKRHDILCEPGQPEWGYPEEQRYESFEELYGPDAYMGDSFPFTLAGTMRTEILPGILSQATVRSGLKPAIVQENTQALSVFQEKSLDAVEKRAAKESSPTPFRENIKS